MSQWQTFVKMLALLCSFGKSLKHFPGMMCDDVVGVSVINILQVTGDLGSPTLLCLNFGQLTSGFGCVCHLNCNKIVSTLITWIHTGGNILRKLMKYQHQTEKYVKMSHDHSCQING